MDLHFRKTDLEYIRRKVDCRKVSESKTGFVYVFTARRYASAV